MKKHLFPLSMITCLVFGNPSFAQQGATREQEAILSNYTSFSAKDELQQKLWEQYNGRQQADHPDAGKLFYFSPGKSNIEILSKRTEYEKYYIDAADPKKITQQKGYLPVHYKKDGNWYTIDTRISASGKGMFEAGSQVEPVGFNTNTQNSYIKTTQGAKVSFNHWTLYGEKDGVETLLAEADWSQYTAGDDGIYIKEVFPGMDAEMRTVRGGIKTSFVLNKNVFGAYTNLVFRDKFSSDASLKLQFKNRSLEGKHVSAAYISTGDEPILEIGKGIMYAQHINATHADMAYAMKGTELSMIVPVSYIDKYISKSPVVIDPIVTGTNTTLIAAISSMYNSSCTFSGSCDFTMSVPTPVGVTFTDVKNIYAVVGNSPCNANDGRWQFRTASCVPGYVWLCSSGSPGACGGTAAEFGIFSPCLPAPSCTTSSNVDFTLRMWRTCKGDTGCSATCFGAYWNWVSNIEGRTVEHANGITLSTNDSVCSGSSVILSKVTINGIAPYSATNWSTSRTGTPSIGSGDSIIRIFPASGTYWTYAFTTDACGNTAMDSVRIYVDTVLTPTVSGAFNYCQSISATALTATTTSSTDTLYWYTTLVGGTGTTMAPIVSTTTPGTFLYYVSQRSILGCEGGRTKATAYVNPAIPPFNIRTADSVLCLGESTKLYVGVGSNDSLTAPLVTGNNNTGIMFDVVAKNTVTVNGFDFHTLTTVTDYPFAIYYKTGTHVGSENTSGDWTLLGIVGVTGSTGSYIKIPLPINVTIPAGSRAAFYLSYTNDAVNLIYHNGSAVGNVVVQDANIQLLEGTGKWYPFTTSFTPRRFEGRVHYNSVSTLWSTSATTDTITVSPPLGFTNYWARITNAVGCHNTDTIAVQVNPIPAAPTVGSTVIYCQNATASALTATAPSPTDTLIWYTTSTGGTGTKTLVPGTTTAGTTTYYVSARSVWGCEGPRTPLNVQINPAGTTPTVTTPVVYCRNATASALTATKASSTDTLYWYTVPTGGTGSLTAPTPSTTTAGTTPYYVSAKTSLGCEGSRATINVQVNPTPVAPTVTTPVALCTGTTVSALTATKPSATDTLYWYTVATGGTGSTTAPTPSTATAGSTTFYVSAKNTFVCEGPRAAITVNVNPTPTAPVVVSPVNYCQGAPSSPLSATKLATTDTLLWYSTPTGGTPSMLVITPSTTTPGTTNYYVSLKTMFGCEGPRATITVTVNPTPAAPTATSPVVYCQGATATALTATKATSSDTLYWYTVPTGGTGSSTAPTPATAATGSTPYYVSAKSSASCEGNRTTVVVTVNPTPAAPSVTASVVYCLNTTAVPLTATKASTTDTLYWYTVATGGTGSITAPTPSTATAGTTNYYVSAKNTSKCEGPRALITVTVNALPAAPTVTSPVNLCIGGPAAALTATGTSIKWYTSPTGGVGSSTAPTPSTAAAGTTNYYVTQTNAGTGCESPRATIAVIVNNLPAAPTVTTPVIYCQNAPATALTATKATSTDTLYWYTVASGGSGSITAPVPSTTTVGSTNYYVSSRSVYGCEGNRAAITVTVNPTPVAPTVTTPVIYCQNVTASPLSATGTDTLKWYTVATGGTASLTPPTPSTATAGTTLRYVSQRNSYGCESPRATITITINAAPANPTVTSPLNLCVGGPSSPLTATGTALKWYTTATGGTGSSTAPTPSTATTGTTVYYVTQTESVNFCESNRASISVVVNPLPAAPAVTSPLNLCIGSVPSALTATGTSLKWYTVATGGSGSSTAPVPSTAAIGSTNYYVSQTSSVGCEGPRALITVAIQPLPVVTVAPVGVPDFFFCFGKTLTVKATSLTAISYQWFSGTTPISGATADTFNTGTTGFYKVVATSVYGCKGEKEVFIQQDTTALPVLAPTDAMICEEGSVLLYCHPAYTGFIFDWIKDGISMSPPMPKANAIPVNMAGTYKVTVTNLYGCINTTNTATVGIYPKPIKPVIVRTDPTLALSPSSYIHYQWYKDGKKIFAATADKYIFSENGKYHAEITDANGCINQSDTIIISNVSVGNVTRDANIKVYPNPTNDILYIEAPFGIKVQVFDLLGKKLIEEQYQDQLRLGNLPDGNYFIKLFDLNNAFITNHKINKITQ